MADTICDFTAVIRGADCFSELADGYPLGTLTRDLRVVPPFELSRQVAVAQVLAIAEPLKSLILKAVDSALRLHSRYHGSTVSLFEGDLIGSERYAVSIYPSRTVELIAALTAEDLLAFVLANLAILLLPQRALGTWFNPATNRHVLDVIVCVRDREAALVLGKRYNQWSAFHLASAQEILIGDVNRDGPSPRTLSFSEVSQSVHNSRTELVRQ